MSCYPSCPDCKNDCRAVPEPTHMGVLITETGAACKCFPANRSCPSSARCRQGHVTLPSGMVRSDDSGKPDYTLIDDRMLERIAVHLTAQVPSKGRDNWRLASTDEDLRRFLQSAWRHFIAWQRGDTDEDHAAALWFNVSGAEHVRAQL